MLTITPEAGGVKDAQGWRERVQEIAVHLRDEFDIIDEAWLTAWGLWESGSR